MPVKRRLAKARTELGQGERLFLAGVPWPLDEEYEGSTPGERYMALMTHCWLTAEHRNDNPASGPTARELWAYYGAEALTARRGAGPHPALLRFGAPPSVVEVGSCP